MFIGEWNKSVILTYVGMASAVLGMYMAFSGKTGIAFVCLMIAGVCDLFDGAVARRCKRTEAQKKFGIQLDSLVDVISFLACPIVLGISIGMTRWYHILVLCVFGICGIARLAFFNVTSEEAMAEPQREGKADKQQVQKPRKFYRGLPVTYTAEILPIVYLLSLCLTETVFNIVYTITMLVIAFFNVLDVKIKKPGGIMYVVFALLAIGMITIYLIFL